MDRHKIPIREQRRTVCSWTSSCQSLFSTLDNAIGKEEVGDRELRYSSGEHDGLTQAPHVLADHAPGYMVAVTRLEKREKNLILPAS